jgi:hypothetical protein
MPTILDSCSALATGAPRRAATRVQKRAPVVEGVRNQATTSSVETTFSS